MKYVTLIITFFYRCWLFACLNAMRIAFNKSKTLEDFEFSQGYLFFWDKVCLKNKMKDFSLVDRLLLLILLVTRLGLESTSALVGGKFNCQSSFLISTRNTNSGL